MAEMRLYGLRIEVCHDVYKPAEDTFMLAESVKRQNFDDVLEIGTGTGVIALLCATRAKRVIALDVSPEAAACARLNARLNGMANIEVLCCDLFGAIRKGELFDLVVFNPPYLPEDGGEEIRSIAWSGGETGRDIIDRFLAEVKGYLKGKGCLLMVGSSLSDYCKTKDILESMGFKVWIVEKKRFFFEELVLIKAVLP